MKLVCTRCLQHFCAHMFSVALGKSLRLSFPVYGEDNDYIYERVAHPTHQGLMHPPTQAQCRVQLASPSFYDGSSWALFPVRYVPAPCSG